MVSIQNKVLIGNIENLFWALYISRGPTPFPQTTVKPVLSSQSKDQNWFPRPSIA